ncbi:MAG: hypothetical protein IH898_10345 [Planctomycetes bacterium]|nr:hypothetical protein [Planctomycetota bacterium]
MSVSCGCSSLGFILFLMTLLTILNTILRSVADSTREIGVFRAVGAGTGGQRSDIASTTLGQAGPGYVVHCMSHCLLRGIR